MTAFLILAGGASTRFDGDKLAEKFNGLTLPQYAALFAVANNATRICVTISDRQIYTDGKTVRHTIVDDIAEIAEAEIAIQQSDRYGTGSAVALWENRINERTVVLFGDNLYQGKMPDLIDDSTLYFTTVFRNEACPNNLRLAAVIDNIVIEKPHQQTHGTYFAGFISKPASVFSTTLRPSARREYEITDIINAHPQRQAIDLATTGIVWGDITSADDVPHINALIR